MGRNWWGVCQLQGAVTAGNDLAGGRASPVKWRQNYDRKLQLIVESSSISCRHHSFPFLANSFSAVGAGSLSWSDGNGIMMPASIAAARALLNSPVFTCSSISGASRARR